jgi:hypothetical protein
VKLPECQKILCLIEAAHVVVIVAEKQVSEGIAWCLRIDDRTDFVRLHRWFYIQEKQMNSSVAC